MREETSLLFSYQDQRVVKLERINHHQFEKMNGVQRVSLSFLAD